jgi:hypothetical protein
MTIAWNRAIGLVLFSAALGACALEEPAIDETSQDLSTLKHLCNNNTTIGNRRCLDAQLDTINNNGTVVQIWDFINNANQNWGFQLGVITIIQNQWSGRCLDADLGTIGGNGTKVQLWDCNGRENQKWAVVPNGKIQNLWSGRCLESRIAGSGTSDNGIKVQLWDCEDISQQKWF